ncbi:MAG TPA: AtzE family amidohydrolase [Casimicrobiaceae bacterium]|nr:AtzE family amidohydrolase [Casimicrobiaceae bacterium]
MRDPLGADATAADIAAAVRAGRVTARAVVDAALARIERANPVLNAFTAVATDRALARARSIDAAQRAGTPLGDLAGVPFGVKAMVDVAGLTTTGGSALFRDAPVATHDAAVVRELEAAGAICIGAQNMDEFGMGGTTENACFGPTRNPHDRLRTPGGSSGGSAAAVAAGMVPLSIGSDGLGSVRLPASLCGVFGLRPTRGLIADDGVMGAGGTLGTLGPLARSSADIALCHRVAARSSATSSEASRGDTNIRIATVGGYFRESLDEEATDALQRVVDVLRIVREVEFPDTRRAKAAAILVNAAESATGRIDALRMRLDRFDPATRERFLAHALLPAQWYLAAQRFRRWHAERMERLFDDVDVLAVPATPCAAPVIGARTVRIGSSDLPIGPALGWFTQPIAGTGCPALTVPIARPGRPPIGVQLVARRYRDDLVFRIAAELEALGVAAAPVAGDFASYGAPAATQAAPPV